MMENTGLWMECDNTILIFGKIDSKKEGVNQNEKCQY